MQRPVVHAHLEVREERREEKMGSRRGGIQKGVDDQKSNGARKISLRNKSGPGVSGCLGPLGNLTGHSTMGDNDYGSWGWGVW